MSETEQREAVVAIARTWIGTPFHHEGRLKGVGVDCGMLIAEVFTEAGLIERPSFAPYSPQFHLHKDDPAYVREVLRFTHEIEAPTAPGDIVIYKVARQHAHGAIISQLTPRRLIHAFANTGCVLEGGETEFGGLVKADKRFFTFWA